MGIAAVFGVFGAGVSAQEPVAGMEVLISIADQKMAVLRDGGLLQKYQISTSRFGAGDAYRSYKTPLGRLRVCDKVGNDLMSGAVIKHREATGEVLDVNAPGRDPIVTRILWLDGMEEQNRNAKARGIYIHGTPEEKKIGEPMSWGCIRMRSKDVMELFDEIPVGTTVFISPERLPKLRKYEPPKPVLIVVHTPPPAPPAKPALIAAHTPPPAPPPKPVPAAPTPAPDVSRIAANRMLPKSAPVAQTTPSSVLQSRIVSTKWSANPVPEMSAPPISVPEIAPPGSAVPTPQKPVIVASSAPKTVVKPLRELAEGPRSRKKQLTDTPPGGDSGAFDAFKGSVLFAGLPDARAPQAAALGEPKKSPPVVQTSIDAPPEEFSLPPAVAPADGAAAAPAPAEAGSHLAARNPPPTPEMFKTAEHP